MLSFYFKRKASVHHFFISFKIIFNYLSVHIQDKHNLSGSAL